MSRPLHFHKPSRAELRTLFSLLETATDPIIRQRATAIVWLCITAMATEVAQILNVHLNTVLHYIRGFHRGRLRWVTQRKKGGRPREISRRIERQIVALVQREPTAVGLPHGTWSLSRLQWFVTKKRKWLRKVSREHLRRLLKKTTFTCGASNANFTAKTHAVMRF